VQDRAGPVLEGGGRDPKRGDLGFAGRVDADLRQRRVGERRAQRQALLLAGAAGRAAVEELVAARGLAVAQSREEPPREVIGVGDAAALVDDQQPVGQALEDLGGQILGGRLGQWQTLGFFPNPRLIPPIVD
jgi:hypothetical protein